MTATLASENWTPLAPEIKEGLDRLLSQIGVIAVGARGSVLVLKVSDPSKAPDDFQGELLKILRSNDARPYRDTFDSAVYN